MLTTDEKDVITKIVALPDDFRKIKKVPDLPWYDGESVSGYGHKRYHPSTLSLTTEMWEEMNVMSEQFGFNGRSEFMRFVFTTFKMECNARNDIERMIVAIKHLLQVKDRDDEMNRLINELRAILIGVVS